jgi:Protein of unknown function (DUF3558)
MSRAVRLGAAVAAAGLLAACSQGTGSGPAPTSASSTAAASSNSATGDAPRVPVALPVADLTSNPCSALSSDQVTQIGLTGSADLTQGQTGPNCRWRSATVSENLVNISPMIVNKNGLSDIYANKAKNAYFEPTTINGYPAVYTDLADLRSTGDCALWVGVTDQLAVSVSAQISFGVNKSTPCPVAQRVATAMVQHLQGSA